MTASAVQPNTWGISLGEARRHIFSELIGAALDAADPATAVRRVMQCEGSRLTVAGKAYDLDRTERIIVAGAGKAGAPMAAALHTILGDRITAGWVNVKRGYLRKDQLVADWAGAIQLHEAGHPVPDEAGRQGAERLLQMVGDLTERDLVICVISGGGSALLPMPAIGITLIEKQLMTQKLLACGATINEFNTVRKHLSVIKGGQLARAAWPARMISLILSDVVGSPLDVIGSGPTAPDSSTFQDAWDVLEKYHLDSQAPDSIRARLEAGRAGQLADTPKPGDPLFDSVQNVVIGDNALSAEAAARRAQQLGLNALVLSTFVEGEAREVGKVAAGLAREIVRYARPLARPACLILGGETTVTLRGQGKGGRNQELALSAALALDGWEGATVLAFATDGTDGPTDAAGAVATWDTAERARRLGMHPQAYLANNDAYHFFETLGDLLLPGPTNTNVNDLTFVVVF